MLDCDTPVLGARAIRLAAAGVAVWSTGLLISGRAGPDLLAATGDSTSPSALSGEAIGAELGSVGETGLAGLEENVGFAVEHTASLAVELTVGFAVEITVGFAVAITLGFAVEITVGFAIELAVGFDVELTSGLARTDKVAVLDEAVSFVLGVAVDLS